MSTQLKEKSHLLTRKMKLTTISPIYIGGGEDSILNKTQYILDQKNRKIYILDEHKWANFLLTKNLFDKYLDFSIRYAQKQISRKGQPPPKYQGGLYDWLEENRINHTQFSSFTKYNIDIDRIEKGNDLRCFIKNSDLKPYIPGSSIKGAIRTAILFALIKNNKQHYTKKYWNDLKKALECQDKRTLNEISSRIEEELLFTVRYKDKEPKKLNAINDTFKGIIVSDSSPIKPTHLTVQQKIDLSTKPNKQNEYLKKLPIFREYLKPATECFFTITIDKNIVSDKYFLDYKTFENSLLSFTHFLIQEETGLLEVFNNMDIPYNYPDQYFEKEGDLYPTLCLGGGSGFCSKVLTYIIAPDIKSANTTIKQYLDLAFSKHKIPMHYHNEFDNKLSPRTLKLANYKDSKHIIGWCDIREVEQIC